MREQQQRAIPQENELKAQPIQSENLLKSDGKAHGSHSCHRCHTHEDTEGHNNHEHNHEHHHHAHSSTKRQITFIAVTAVLLAAAVLIERYCALQTWQLLLVYLVPYLLIGTGTLKEAAEGIARGNIFNEHFLMSLATIGALCIGFLPGAETEFPEAVFVMLFFAVGELFESYAEGRSRDSISHLMEIRPDAAEVERGGQTRTVTPEEVSIGEVIVVRPGGKIPLDGTVIEGSSSLNTVALTGESLPRDVEKGDDVASGCINLSGVLRIRTTKTFGESTVSKIIRLVENADSRKSRSESFITRFARIYTPIVVSAALLLAFVPPLLSGNGFSGFSASFATWLHRALIFLVVSCPCALVISVPLTFFGGLGGASRRGILIKGSSFMDSLANVGTVVFDKTGTLTRGEFAVEAVHPEAAAKPGSAAPAAITEHELLHLAAHVEHFSTHPIGEALRAAFPNEATDGCSVTDVEEIAGQGIRANVEGRTVCVGNARMMEAVGAAWHDCHRTGTIIHVAVDGQYAGHIVINDRVKEDSAEAISALRRLGVGDTVMLTGDREETARDVASRLGIGSYRAGLLPADKVQCLEELLAAKPRRTSLAFVGDGINDAPVLKRADVGIAMGGLGSDAAIEAADVVLMDDRPSKIATAVSIARRTLRIARQNVWLAIGIKAAILLLAAFGLATLWLAVFADVGVTVLAVLNAMRALRVPTK
ncbi:MAG TPA: cadmium-translocating P-type ATPase [Candidatus Coprenecus merdigallinarum]|nr:cadmium-translocating P-type ATPase [Candidatus Coprenecus merdigallinarum]